MGTTLPGHQYDQQMWSNAPLDPGLFSTHWTSWFPMTEQIMPLGDNLQTILFDAMEISPLLQALATLTKTPY